MQKVLVIGSPGAGKSVFSRELSNITQLPLYHLDLLYHKADKAIVSKAEFDAELAKLLAKDQWILDGNYQRTLEWRLQACDTVFLLDIPTALCLAGARSRIGQKRIDFPWIDDKLDPGLEQKILNFDTDKRPQIYELFQKYQQVKNIIIFQTRAEADDYLQQLRANHS